MQNIPIRYELLITAIEAGEAETGVTAARDLIEAGALLKDIFAEAVTPCLKDIGDRFSRLELYLPDMMRSADVVKAIHAALGDTLKGEADLVQRGRIVIGTVYGDIHDLGKNIVTSMLEVNGFEVHDLGVDVEAYSFIEKARAVEADIIAVSSLLTTSLPYVADIIGMLKENQEDGQRFKTMIGGGPVTAAYAAEIGADAFGNDAADAVRVAHQLIEAKDS